jgi:hypothetical protein
LQKLININMSSSQVDTTWSSLSAQHLTFTENQYLLENYNSQLIRHREKPTTPN